ncbi:hypothetical protein MRB53_039046 [Persea americana]|nr:hypothetical protein MRB53_039046 [Persea americana]
MSSAGSSTLRGDVETRDENARSPDRHNSTDVEKTAIEAPAILHIATQEEARVPNGGWKAWTVVLGAFLAFFNSWGISNTFGAFQDFYGYDLLASSTPSAISWIGTFQAFLLIASSLFTGPLLDLGYIRSLNFVGSVLVVFGLMMTSLCKEYYQFFLAQGLVIGIGAGCLFAPNTAVVATYFSTKRALALGIAASGSSLGGVIYPIVFRSLQPRIGFGWATRIIGFIALATLVVVNLTVRTRVPPSQRARRLVDPAAFRNIPFVIFTLGEALAFVGLYFPFFYMPIFAEQVLGADVNLSYGLLSILNAASIFGRVLPAFVADLLGALNVICVCTTMAAILAYTWMSVTAIPGAIVFCVFYGFFSGAIVSLQPTVLTGLAPSLSIVGTWMGMSFSIAGLGLLIGNPIAGVLTNVETGAFDRGQIFSATTLLAAPSLL